MKKHNIENFFVLSDYKVCSWNAELWGSNFLIKKKVSLQKGYLTFFVSQELSEYSWWREYFQVSSFFTVLKVILNILLCWKIFTPKYIVGFYLKNKKGGILFLPFVIFPVSFSKIG
jgi:hypothetical protein